MPTLPNLLSPSPDLRERVVITDVALRDGLQNQPQHVGTAGKAALLRALAAAGVPSIEATSFVSPKAVPQMADATAVIAEALALAPLRASALAPNLKGLERAIAAGTQEVAVVLSCTETMNRKNINMSLVEATRVGCETLRAARAQGLATRGYLAVAFECPFEGPTPPERVVELGLALVEAGADEIVVADTIGAARPGASTTAPPPLAAATCPSIGSACTCTTRAAWASPTHTPVSSSACAASTRVPAASAAARSRPARRAMSRPRTWC